jgi:triosephosphate isomerase
MMKPKQTWLVANWKMNGDVQRVQGFAYAINATVQSTPASLQVVFCPPFPYLSLAKQALPQNTRVQLGAQNCHREMKGAHTGEVSAAMLADIGCRYVIVGHSERRACGVTDVDVQSKAEAAMAVGLVPIICIGESLAAYNAGKTSEMLAEQLGFLARLSLRTYLVAYEPIWAIGTGKVPQVTEIQAVHTQIKSTLGSETSVLYGGSVNPSNGEEILALPEVAGALIGGASLEIDSMRAMIAAVR